MVAIKGKGSNVRFDPTKDERSLCKSLAGLGLKHEEIAGILCIGLTVLRRDFADELERGIIEANAKVTETLFRMATSGNVPAATFFWLKCRAHWREVTHVEVSGDVSLKNVSDNDLEREVLALRARAAIAGGAGDLAEELSAEPNGILH